MSASTENIFLIDSLIAKNLPKDQGSFQKIQFTWILNIKSKYGRVYHFKRFSNEVSSTTDYFSRQSLSVSQTWMAPTEVTEFILLPKNNSFSDTSLRIGLSASTSLPLMMKLSLLQKLSQSVVGVTNSSWFSQSFSGFKTESPHLLGTPSVLTKLGWFVTPPLLNSGNY